MITTIVSSTKPSAKPSNGGNGKAQTSEANPVPAQTPVIEASKPLSIDEKIQRVSDLSDLITKRNRLLESKNKLNSFNLKREDATTRITIQDGEGNSFITSQSVAIEKIITILKDSIDIALADTEAKIQF